MTTSNEFSCLTSLLNLSTPGVTAQSQSTGVSEIQEVNSNGNSGIESISICGRDIALAASCFPKLRGNKSVEQAIRYHYLSTGTTPLIQHFRTVSKESWEPISFPRDPKIQRECETINGYSQVVQEIFETKNKTMAKIAKELKEAQILVERPFIEDDVQEYDLLNPLQTIYSTILKTKHKKAKTEQDDTRQEEKNENIDPYSNARREKKNNISRTKKTQRRKDFQMQRQGETATTTTTTTTMTTTMPMMDAQLQAALEMPMSNLRQPQQEQSQPQHQQPQHQQPQSQSQSQSQSLTQPQSKISNEKENQDELWLDDSFKHLCALTTAKKKDTKRKMEFGMICCGKVEVCGKKTVDVKAFAVAKFITSVLRFRVPESEIPIYSFYEQDCWVNETESLARHEFYLYWNLWNKANILKLQRLYYIDRQSMGPDDFFICLGSLVGDAAICTHVFSSTEGEDTQTKRMKSLEEHVRICLAKTWDPKSLERKEKQELFKLSLISSSSSSSSSSSFSSSSSSSPSSSSLPSIPISEIKLWAAKELRIWSPHPYLSRENHLQSLAIKKYQFDYSDLPSDVIWCKYHPYFKNVEYVQENSRNMIVFDNLVPFCPTYQSFRDVPMKVKECYWILRQKICASTNPETRRTRNLLLNGDNQQEDKNAFASNRMAIRHGSSLELSEERKMYLRNLIYKIYENFKSAKLNTYYFSHLAFWNSFEMVNFLLQPPQGIPIQLPVGFFQENAVFENTVMTSSILPTFFPNRLLSNSQKVIDLGLLIYQNLKWWDVYRVKQLLCFSTKNNFQKRKQKKNRKEQSQTKQQWDKQNGNFDSRKRKCGNQSDEILTSMECEDQSLKTEVKTKEKQAENEETEEKEERGEQEIYSEEEKLNYIFVSNNRITLTITLPLQSFLLLHQEASSDFLYGEAWHKFLWTDEVNIKEYRGELDTTDEKKKNTIELSNFGKIQVEKEKTKTLRLDTIEQINLFLDLVCHVTLAPEILLRSTFHPKIGISSHLNSFVSSSPLQDLLEPHSRVSKIARETYNSECEARWVRKGQKSDLEIRLQRRSLEQMECSSESECENEYKKEEDQETHEEQSDQDILLSKKSTKKISIKATKKTGISKPKKTRGKTDREKQKKQTPPKSKKPPKPKPKNKKQQKELKTKSRDSNESENETEFHTSAKKEVENIRQNQNQRNTNGRQNEKFQTKTPNQKTINKPPKSKISKLKSKQKVKSTPKSKLNSKSKRNLKSKQNSLNNDHEAFLDDDDEEKGIDTNTMTETDEEEILDSQSQGENENSNWTLEDKQELEAAIRKSSSFGRDSSFSLPRRHVKIPNYDEDGIDIENEDFLEVKTKPKANKISQEHENELQDEWEELDPHEEKTTSKHPIRKAAQKAKKGIQQELNIETTFHTEDSPNDIDFSPGGGSDL